MGVTINNCLTVNHLVQGVMAVLDVSASAAMSKLKTWSTEVQSSFTANNAAAIGCLHATDDIVEVPKSNGIVMTAMYQKMESMERRMSNLERGVAGVQDDVTDIGLPSPPHSPQKRKAQQLSEIDLSLDSSSSSSSSSSSFKKGGAEKIQNEKLQNIDALLEAAVREDAITGSGENFCLGYCLKRVSCNEQKKVKTTMKFVYDHIDEEDMKVLKNGNPGNDNEKTMKLKKTCSTILEKVTAAILLKQGK
jgi:hypothetical protein